MINLSKVSSAAVTDSDSFMREQSASWNYHLCNDIKASEAEAHGHVSTFNVDRWFAAI